MKSFLKILILLLIVGGIFFQFRPQIERGVLPVWHLVKNRIFKVAPCEEPIPYDLGTFDAKFNISKTYFLSALADAEAIWEEPTGKNLFVHKPGDTSYDLLKINLIYDYRQAATSKLNTLGIVVKDDKATYDSLKAKLTQLKNQYENELAAFNQKVDAFNTRQEAYQKSVAYWNSQGGAPKSEYQKLQAESAALKEEANDLKSTQTHLNAMVDELNALVATLNRLAGSLNLNVEKYNTVGASRGETFEEGVYVSEGINREIDIYEFSNRDKLVRVLAHELGHALGLEHVEDPKAIMYKLNQGSNMSLTAADLGALTALCGAQ